ncbi:hypothetical protein [Methylotetracoccus oryzae]|uniref:hypothetical protein n=1 Tax=Methylotetracoccus oryzae TaxID=1919059 RepID=UPI0013A53C88|nr:hypothetical protein [Methylotetracoccus oryzae]
MATKCLTGFDPLVGRRPTPADHDFPLPLRYRISGSRSLSARTRSRPSWAEAFRLDTRGVEAGLVALLGFGAAAYFGLYQGVALGVGEILEQTLGETVGTVELLEGLVRMMVGWIVFLVTGFATIILSRHCLNSGEPPVSPEPVPEGEKEHGLGYD